MDLPRSENFWLDRLIFSVQVPPGKFFPLNFGPAVP